MKLNMIYTDFSEKLIGLQDLIATKIENTGTIIKIYAEIKQKPHICPACGHTTDAICDYRTQQIEDIPAFGKTAKSLRDCSPPARSCL